MRNNRGTHSELTIWQQNLNKSQTGQHDLDSSGKLANTGTDIATLQELVINFLRQNNSIKGLDPSIPVHS